MRRYRRRTLDALVARAPVTLEHARYVNLPGFFAWLLVVRLLGRHVDEGAVGAYDRLVPAVRAVEDRWAPPFGQSLLAVLRTT